jgi:ubiquinone/menaquinone biosynthesis C-methylase UbiE
MQQETWAKGDFSVVANIVFNDSEKLVEALQILPGERVLDVACGSGNGALAAARRAWGNTVGCDFVPALLERGRERAAAERLEIEFVEADAQDLPFGDGEFDVVMSVFGAMFAPTTRRPRRSCCG